MGLAGHAWAAASVEAAASTVPAISAFTSCFMSSLSLGFASVGGDVAVLDDLSVALAVGVDEGGELCGRAAHRDRALVEELLAHVGRADDLAHVARDLVDRLARRAGGRDEADPRSGVEAGEPALRERG